MAKKKKSKDDKRDIALLLKFLDSGGKYFGEPVTIRIKHSRGESLKPIEFKATKAIEVTGLRRTPRSDYYTVTVTPSKRYDPRSEFVRIPASGFAELTFTFEREEAPKGVEPTLDRHRKVGGHVLREDGLTLPGVRIHAIHQDRSGSVRLGEDTSDAGGLYTIRYAMPPSLQSINLQVSALGDDGETLAASELIRNAKPQEDVNLTVPFVEKTVAERRIEGRIFLEHGLPAEQLKLRLYKRGFGGETTLLDETTTLGGGQYAFNYDPGGRQVSLEVRAVDAEDKEIPLSKPLNGLSSQLPMELNLLAPGNLQPLAAEYQRLSADLKAQVGQMAKLAQIKENGDQQDLTVLNRATGWDARLIALAAATERLQADADLELPRQAIYGLLRAGLPSDKLMLAQVEPDAAELALKAVRDAGIVEFNDQQIGEYKKQFATFANEVRLDVPAAGSGSTYGELLEVSGLEEDAQIKFASVFFDSRASGAQLWDEARKAGLDDTQIRSLQRQGKFAFLAGNSQAMTARLMQMEIDDPVELVEQDLYRAERWKAEVQALADEEEEGLAALIPGSYAGENIEERLDVYAKDMARKVRLSYPTQVLGRIIEQDDADTFGLGEARAETAKLLREAASEGFRFGVTPAEAFFKEHGGLGASEDDLRDSASNAKQHIKKLQRTYQISSSNEGLSTLMSLGMTSAYAVMAHSETAFVQLYEDKYLEIFNRLPLQGEAQVVYRRAKQISSVTYNLFTIAKKLNSEAPVRVLSASVEERESVRNELVKQYPTMESLFGSIDFCECEHCRSVLSPAAYLVDLLQFIDAEPEAWESFLRVWKKNHDNQEYTAKYKKPYDALIERRPDLPHIPLTCQNTLTALPYIDIVNEILEYYVANGKLEEQAAHDTGEATTAELLAEPQNVIQEAYDELRQSRYPLDLPFDLWIETVRRFCNYFETPLAQILGALRPSDELFSPTQVFDRSSIFIESLGLSPADAAIFTDPDPLAKWHELYGFETSEKAKTKATDATTGQRIDLNSAKALSRRLGVSYKELVEIVQTAFVNPQLSKLGLLYKLGVSIHDARFYLENRNLLQQVPASLSTDDLERRLEAEAFAQKLQKLAADFRLQPEQLESELEEIPFDKVLLLADPDAGCNFDLTTLRYANGDPADDIAFLRINLFVRLWRKLGWSIAETDGALQAFVPKNTPFEEAHLDQQPLRSALIYLAHLKALEERVRVGKQSRLKLTTLWSDIATTGKSPLYAQLFLTRAVLKSGEVEITVNKMPQRLSVFDHPLGRYLTPAGLAKISDQVKHEVRKEKVKESDQIDPGTFADPKISLRYDELAEVQYLAYKGTLTDQHKAELAALSESPALPTLLDAVQLRAQEFVLVKGHLLSLQGALGLTASEIDRILEDAGMSLDAAELSLPNVSLLYRYGLLAKALGLSVRELISLKQLSGLDPFKQLHPEPLKKLDEDYPFTQALRFVEVAEQIKESGLKIEDLEYLLRHRFDEVGKYRPDRKGMLALLKTLAEGVQAIRAEHALPESPGLMSEEKLRQKLGLALAPDVIETFLAMINGKVEFTATASGVEPADRFRSALFVDEALIHGVSYKEVPHKEQKLTLRGVLFEPQETELLTKFDAELTAAQKTAFAQLLESLKAQARAFFDSQLKKQRLRLEGEAGFLEDADFDLLFRPLQPLKQVLSTDAQGEVDNKLKENEKIEAENQVKLQERRYRVAQAFLPFLRQRLIRQFIVQAMTAHTGGDPGLVESLLTDERLLGRPKPLLEAFSATVEQGITTIFFAAPDSSGPPLSTIVLADVDTGIEDRDGNSFRPDGADSARFEGYLEVPAPGAYRFYVALEKKDAEAELRFDHLPDPIFWRDPAGADNALLGDKPDQFLELESGVLYAFTLVLHKLNGGEARMLVQGETLPKESLAQLTLYPRTIIEEAEHAAALLTKVLQLLQSLELSEPEVRYLATNAKAFDSLSLGELPTKRGDGTPTSAKPLFGQFLRLAGYARLKRDLASGTHDLIEIFQATGTGELDQVYPLIAKLTRRTEVTVRTSAKALFAAPAFDSEIPLQRLWELLLIIERFGVPVESLLEWTRIVSPAATPERRFEIARDLKEAIKARFEPETWQRVAQPIFDKLRRRQRDALVAHVMRQQGFDRLEKLYEHFLIDPGMEPVVQTSRIRLAIASLQLFIQRCLLNLEPQVHPSVIDSKQWEWMKRYRVWEANRKIFLFPENWLEPEFRDDKTHLFAELEGTLLQGDVSNDLAEDAFLNYLKKLDELARLDIVAMHLEDNPDPALRTLHIFGRTYSQPHKYFYRRYSNQMWTPWEPVNAEIEGDHLAPVAWRDRLYLFWVTFLERAPEASSDQIVDPTKEITIPAPRKDVEAHLHWAEYLQGEWTTRESSGFNLPNPVIRHRLSSFDSKSVSIHVSKATGKEHGVYIHLGGDINWSFYLEGRNSTPERRPYAANSAQGARPKNPYTTSHPHITRYAGSGPLIVAFNQRITTDPGREADAETPQILQRGRQHNLLLCNNNITLDTPGLDSLEADNPAAVEAAIKSGLPEIASLIKPVFYQDNEHTLFIEPNVQERTIEEWQEWVTRTPQPETDWLLPERLEDLAIIPYVPWRGPIPDPGDPLFDFRIDQESLINPPPEFDWIINPATVLMYDGVVIGPDGQSGVGIVAADAFGGIAETTIPVHVNSGGGLVAGSAVVLGGTTTLEQAGLTQTAGGLNVVGSAGFNSALAQNFGSTRFAGISGRGRFGR